MNRVETCRHERSAGVGRVPLVSPLKERLAARTSKSTTIPASWSEAIIHQVHSLSKIPFRTLAERNKRFV